MNYFEVKKRLEVLEEFLRLYREYLTFTNRFENPAAEIIRQKLRPLAPMTINCLREVKIGTIIARDAPSRGQKVFRINIIKAIFRESLIRHFQLDDQAPLHAVEAAVVIYRVRRSRAFVQLFNPFFWLVIFVAGLADTPFELLHRCGFAEADELRRTGVGKIIKLVITALIILLFVELSGLRGWAWNRLGL